MPSLADLQHNPTPWGICLAASQAQTLRGRGPEGDPRGRGGARAYRPVISWLLEGVQMGWM